MIGAVRRRLCRGGVQPGDVVPIVARNRAEWVVAMFGLVRAEAQSDDERAIDTLATIWVKSVYWLPESP